MVLSWTSDEIQVTNGGTGSITIPSGIVISGIWGDFQGTSTETGGPQSASGDVGGSWSVTFPNPSGGITYNTYSGYYSEILIGGSYIQADCGTIYVSEGSWTTMAPNPRYVTGPGTQYATISSYYTDCSSTMPGHYSCTWSNYVETKTSNPSFYIDDAGETSGYTGTINNDYWEMGTQYSGDTTDLTVGASNTLHFTIGGSGQAGFRLYVEFTYARPTKLHEMRIQSGATTVSLPLVSNTDPAIEVKGLRACLNGTVYTIDAVDTADSEASGLRFVKGGTTYAVRKVI